MRSIKFGRRGVLPTPRAIRRKGGCWIDRQAPSTHQGVCREKPGAAASTAHTISLWKIPSIDSALIRQAALGIPPRFLLGWLRSKRELGWGLEHRLPFPSIQMRLSLLGNSLQSLPVLPPPGAAGLGSKWGETPYSLSRSSRTVPDFCHQAGSPSSCWGGRKLPSHVGSLTLPPPTTPLLPTTFVCISSILDVHTSAPRKHSPKKTDWELPIEETEAQREKGPWSPWKSQDKTGAS